MPMKVFKLVFGLSFLFILLVIFMPTIELPNKDLEMISAIESNDQKKINVLLKSGWDVNKPLYYKKWLWAPFAQVMGYDGRAPLGIAIGYSNVELVRFLIEHGANVNQVQGWEESTPLHFAENCLKFKCKIPKNQPGSEYCQPSEQIKDILQRHAAQ